jgi:hypothetical protein
MTYTQQEIDRMKADLKAREEAIKAKEAELKVLQEESVANPPGISTSPGPSSGEEAEKAAIFRPHYEATQAEVDAMTMEQYMRWRELGYHLKKSPEEVALDAEAEERDRARAAELALIDSMTTEQYALYQEGKALKAQGEKEAVAKLTERERQDKLNALRRKNPDDMSMEEYAQWVELRDRR